MNEEEFTKSKTTCKYISESDKILLVLGFSFNKIVEKNYLCKANAHRKSLRNGFGTKQQQSCMFDSLLIYA